MMANLPPREELWAAVQEAHDFLYQYLNDPNSRKHPTEGEVEFNAYNWGLRYPGGCEVCLAGLWYLHKVGRLLEVDDSKYECEGLPPLCRFLDKLRCPDDNADEIEEQLGVSTHSYPSQDGDGNMLYSDNPKHILDFLTWLLDKGQAYGVYVL